MANRDGASERQKTLKAVAVCVGLLAATLLVLFLRSLSPSQVLFANDGPLGANMTASADLPEGFKAIWNDLNWLGTGSGGAPLTVTNLLLWWLRPLAFAKFYDPLALLLLGLSAWAYFWQAGFRPWVCVLGALATGLNSNIFSNVCWGLGTRAVCVA